MPDDEIYLELLIDTSGPGAVEVELARARVGVEIAAARIDVDVEVLA